MKKKTMRIDEKTLQEAKDASGASTDRDGAAGLQALIRHAAYQRLRKLRGSEKDAADVPRLGEAGTNKRIA